MLEIRLLGRFELKIDGLKVALGSRKTTALIAYLALEGVTPRSELAHHLWTDSTEEAARRSLRQELWQIQKTDLGKELHLEGESVGLTQVALLDVQLFPALLEADDLTAALTLYRGVLLEGFKISGASAFEEWLEVKREFFAGLRRDALAKQAQSLESVGDLRGALIAHLELLTDNPLLEVHQRDAMRLMAMLGEPALALERFENFKRLLREELSLEPLPETLRLAERIRASEILEPTLKSKVFHVSDSLTSPLIGRDAAWALLEKPKAGLTVVFGVPGVGKTRLVEEFARTTSGVLWFHASEVAIETPFYPIAQALRAALEIPDIRAKLEALEVVWKSEVARLIPELGITKNSSNFETPSPDGRTRFLEGLTRALLVISQPNGLIVFDDLHWADTASLELFAHLISQRKTNAAIPRLLATARELELQENKAAVTLFRNLKRQDQLQVVPLEKLNETDVQALVQSMSGGGSSSASLFSKRLYAATSGNPLYLLQTIRHLFEIGTLFANEDGWNTAFDDTTSDYAELSIPASVYAAVLERVAHLGGEAKRVLEAASLAEDGFGLETLIGVTALSEWEGLEALERLTATNLIVSFGDGYGFAHDLVRRALEESLSLERKRILHKRLAVTLEQQNGAPSVIARHFELAGKPSNAAPWRVKAGEMAASVYANREALTQYALALENGLDDRAAFVVHNARFALLTTLEEAELQLLEIRAMFQISKRFKAPELEVTAILAKAAWQTNSGYSSEALLETNRALEIPEISELQATLALKLKAGALIELGRLVEAEVELHAALERCPTDELSTQTRIYQDLSLNAYYRSELQEARSHNAMVFKLCDRTGDRLGRVKAQINAGVFAMFVGELQESSFILKQALIDAREIGHVNAQRTILLNLIKLQLDVMELDATLPLLEEGMALTQSFSNPDQESAFLISFSCYYWLRGDLGAALEAAQAATNLSDTVTDPIMQVSNRTYLIDLRLAIGDTVSALTLLQSARELKESNHLDLYSGALEYKFAWYELVSGQPNLVLARIEQASNGSINIREEDRIGMMWLTAAARFALNQPQTALEAISHLETAPTLEVWGRALTLRLRLYQALGFQPNPDIQTARTLIASGTIPPLEALELRRALAQAINSTSPTEARALQEQASQLTFQMAQTLPLELQVRFLANYGLETSLEFAQDAP